MRELKFRCYSIPYARMYTPITSRIIVESENNSNDNIKIMQYTDLKDKNGVEIYEGDILYHPLQGNRFVEYGSPFKNYGGYMLVSKNGMRGTLNDTDKLYEVIGNIYENMYLLKEGN